MTLDPWQIATGCIALLTALLAYIGNLYASRIENHAKLLVDHSDRITKMEARALTKSDLQETADRIERTIEMHIAYIRAAMEQSKKELEEARHELREAAKRA